MSRYLFEMDLPPGDLMLPQHWPASSDWTPRFENFFASREFQELQTFLTGERQNQTVFPAPEDVFRAFELTSFEETKVVILGQDPYHGAGQAHGLSFSVPEGERLPPSLRNIFKELYADYELEPPDFKTMPGDLTHWATQGVLLLNTVLTVRESSAGSHQKKGWEAFTDLAIQSLNEHHKEIVFVLWGNHAGRKRDLIDNRHCVIASAHPSPLSASRGFFGSRPFSRINDALVSSGRKTINWIV